MFDPKPYYIKIQKDGTLTIPDYVFADVNATPKTEMQIYIDNDSGSILLQQNDEAHKARNYLCRIFWTLQHAFSENTPIIVWDDKQRPIFEQGKRLGKRLVSTQGIRVENKLIGYYTVPETLAQTSKNLVDELGSF